MLLAAEAVADVPTFVSGPTVISYTNRGFYPDASTLVFGRTSDLTDNFSVMSRTGNGTGWNIMSMHHHTIAGGYDGDIAAAYLSPSGATNHAMTCGHSAASPGFIFCARGFQDDVQFGGNYLADETPYQVGWGTFNPGSSPVLVNIGAAQGYQNLMLLARGQDDQIWLANYNGSNNSWNGWYQITPPPGDSFSTDPAAATYSAQDDLVMVCARRQSNQTLTCNKQVYGGWAGWADVLPYESSTTFEPALTQGTSNMYLFAVLPPSNVQGVTTSSVGGNAGNWTDWIYPISWGWNFLNGPAAVASRTNPFGTGLSSVLTVGRAGDSTYWFDVANPDQINHTSEVWGDWTLIQTNPFPM